MGRFSQINVSHSTVQPSKTIQNILTCKTSTTVSYVISKPLILKVRN